jgi:hypothetical protein
MQSEHDAKGEKLVLSEAELSQVNGGASIYVDGLYWGEGTLDYFPWPNGIPIKYNPVYRDISR